MGEMYRTYGAQRLSKAKLAQRLQQAREDNARLEAAIKSLQNEKRENWWRLVALQHEQDLRDARRWYRAWQQGKSIALLSALAGVSVMTMRKWLHRIQDERDRADPPVAAAPAAL